jgi:hypothetical protein
VTDALPSVRVTRDPPTPVVGIAQQKASQSTWIAYMIRGGAPDVPRAGDSGKAGGLNALC